MEQFAEKIAVVTGGGTGMGRELARQLSADRLRAKGVFNAIPTE